MTQAAKRQTTTTIKKMMDGRLRLERRNQSQMIYARTFAQGKDRVKSTGETGLAAATKVAEEWWHEVRRLVQKKENLDAPTFADAAESFLDAALNEHSASQVRNFRDKWSVLKPYFADAKIAAVDKAFLLNVRSKRSQSRSLIGDLIKPATLKKDMLFIRLVFRHARDKKWIESLPEFPTFTRHSKWEIRKARRPRFTKSEYFRLLRTAVRRAKEPGLNPRTKRQREELVYFIVITTGAALRVGEAYSIRWRDCEVHDGSKGRSTHEDFTSDMHSQLSFTVVGKHSNGIPEEARGNRSAYRAYLRMVLMGDQTGDQEKLFQHNHRDGFRELLNAAGLRISSKGRMRNLKSLRPTGISLKLDAPHRPNYFDVAKWTRTSVAMIEDYYDQREDAEAVDRVMIVHEPESDDWETDLRRSIPRSLAVVKRVVRDR